MSSQISNNNADENRPYEFGFTIDGEQHRYEKKGKFFEKKKIKLLLLSISDINGIIQGEFGFITGDGVYHVTVYATDENGNFRILSMRNVKISERKYLGYMCSVSTTKTNLSNKKQIYISIRRNRNKINGFYKRSYFQTEIDKDFQKCYAKLMHIN